MLLFALGVGMATQDVNAQTGAQPGDNFMLINGDWVQIPPTLDDVVYTCWLSSSDLSDFLETIAV